MNVDISTIPLGFGQCYVLKGDGVMAIDAGAPKKGAAFARALEAAAIDPHDVRLVLLTQANCDMMAKALNTRPRKRLGYRTPEECFHGN